jgi:predicted GNAT superfamily acetyltransferase
VNRFTTPRQAAAGAAAAAEVEVRELTAMDELRAAQRLVNVIWRTPVEQPLVVAELLKAIAYEGGYVAGAWRNKELVGVSIGFLAGGRNDLHLHSHITGVDPGVQSKDIGRALKLDQRAWALERDLATVTWTFDPLLRRNAWFNLVSLGAEVVSFHPDFYGAMSDAVNAGDHSDRAMVRWDLDSDVARAAAAGERRCSPHGKTLLERDYQIALEPDPRERPVVRDVDGPHRLYGVPDDAEALRATDPDAHRAWRVALRDSFGTALASGLRATSMTADRWYVVTR